MSSSSGASRFAVSSTSKSRSGSLPIQQASQPLIDLISRSPSPNKKRLAAQKIQRAWRKRPMRPTIAPRLSKSGEFPLPVQVLPPPPQPLPKKPKKSPQVPKRLKGDQEGVVRSHKGKRYKLVRAKKNLIWKQIPRSPPRPSQSSTSRLIAEVNRAASIAKKSLAARRIQGAWRKRRMQRAEPFDVDLLPDVRLPAARIRKASSRVPRIATKSFPKTVGTARARRYLSEARKALGSANRSLARRGLSVRSLSIARKDLSMLQRKLASLAMVPGRVSVLANRINKAAVKARRVAKERTPTPALRMSELDRLISNLKKGVVAEGEKQQQQKKKKKQVALDAGCIHFVIKPECMNKVCGGASA